MRHRLNGIPTYRLNGLGKGDEHPAYAPFGVLRHLYLLEYDMSFESGSVVLTALQEIKLMTNASLVRTLNQTFNDCDNTTGSVGRTKPASFLRHPVGAMATFSHVYTAPGRYWVIVWAHGVSPGTNKSQIVTSNISVVVTTLIDEIGLALLLVPKYTYVDEPLLLTILIHNRIPDVDVIVDFDNDAGRWPVNVVENSTKTTLQEVIGSNRYQNRYRIAARSRPHSTNVDEITTVYSRLDVAHTIYQVGELRIRVTFSQIRTRIAGNREKFTMSAVVAVRQRPTLADEVGTVMIVPHKPAYVNEPVEFLYAVQRPNAQLEYRLDFGDGTQWSTVSANSTMHLPGWMNSSRLDLHGHNREFVTV